MKWKEIFHTYILPIIQSIIGAVILARLQKVNWKRRYRKLVQRTKQQLTDYQVFGIIVFHSFKNWLRYSSFPLMLSIITAQVTFVWYIDRELINKSNYIPTDKTAAFRYQKPYVYPPIVQYTYPSNIRFTPITHYEEIPVPGKRKKRQKAYPK